MREQIAAVVEDLRSNPRVASFDEAGIKQAIILRLLVALGWDQYNVDEIAPDYGVEDGKVDYALRLAGDNKVFIAAKRSAKRFNFHQQRLLNYSFKQSVQFAVLTNGITWWFYLPLREGNGNRTRICSVSIVKHDAIEVASRFVDLLSRENVLSGAAFRNAESLYYRLQQGRVIDETLPKAWESLISDPNSLLVDLLEETVEGLIGLKPGPASIRRFLAEKVQASPVSKRRDSIPRGPIPTIVRPVLTGDVRSRIRRIAADQYTGKSIIGFVFDGNSFEVSRWKDLLTTLAEEVHNRHAPEFERVGELHGSKHAYFSRDERELRLPLPVGNSGYFVDTHLSAKMTIQISYRLLFLFSYSERDLKIQTE